MRLIKIQDYIQTMVLGKPVYDGKGRILLNIGRTIHPNILKRVEEMGISHLIVEDNVSTGIKLHEMLDMPTWMDAVQVLKEAYSNVQNSKPLPLIKLQKMSHKLIHEVKQRRIIVLIPSTYIGEDLKDVAHSVNVALLALQIAKEMSYNELELRDVAIGALLHDIGKVLTDDKTKHPEAGFNYLRNNREINLKAAHIALQHHEYLDGSGYPRGIKDDQFIDYAQIGGVANLYDNMIHSDGIPPHEAIELLMSQNERTYSNDIINAIVRSIPSYAPGSLVELTNGETAIVTEIRTHIHRPVVKVLSTGKEISLADSPTVIISKLISDRTKQKIGN